MVQGVRMADAAGFRPAAGAVIGVKFVARCDGMRSVCELGTWSYVHQPRFSARAVAVTDGVTACVCEPAAFPWDRIDGREWVSHDREFNRAVFNRLQESFAIQPYIEPSAWHDTAAACAFLQLPRDLAGACRDVLGAEADRGVRNARKDVRGADAAQGTLFVMEHCAAETAEAVACHALWREVGHLWPEHERRLYELTCDMGRRGLCVDWETAGQKAGELNRRVAELAGGIPWTPPLSVKKFGAACRDSGVEPPRSTAADDEEYQTWAEAHAGTGPGRWAADMASIRRCGRLAGVLEAMRLRRKPDGRMAYDLKYFGASPGRWAGCGGLNVQNFNRKETEGLDVRKCLMAAPGHMLAVADYSQIEARVLLYLAGDADAIKMLEAHPEWDMYELHARATMGWRPEVRGQRSEDGNAGTGDFSRKDAKTQSEEDAGEGTFDTRRSTLDDQGVREETLKEFCERTGSGLRQLAKARVLGLGFRCGAATFVRVAREMAGLRIGHGEARRIVREYRESNPKIVRLWDDLQDAAEMCAKRPGGEYRLPFPCTRHDPRCGRYLIYRDLQRLPGGRGLTAVVGGERVPLHGGIIAENWTQGTARDVMASAWLRCAAAGYVPVLSVHDELVFEVPVETARDDLRRIVSIMERPVAWAKGLPLKVDGKLMERYGK